MASRRLEHRFARSLLVAILATVVAACGAAGATSAPAETSAHAAEASPAPTLTPTSAPAATLSPTATPAPTAAPSATAEPSPTGEPTAAPTNAPIGPNGQTGRIVLDEQALALTLPKGWLSVALTAEDMSAMLDALPDGTVPATLKDQLPSMVASGLKLWAWDVQGDGLGANCNVIAQPVTIPPALLMTTAQAGLSMVSGISGTNYTDVKIGGSTALRIDYRYVQGVSGASVSLTGTQVYLARPDNLVVVTVTILSSGTTTDRDKIVKSIELLD